MLNEANQRIGLLGAQIDKLREQAAEYYHDWKRKTLAPGESPPPLEVSKGDEGNESPWFWRSKKKEHQARENYAAVLEQLKTSEDGVARKAHFTADVKGLDIAGTSVLPALGDLVSGVRKIGSLLDGAAERLESVCRDASNEQLTDAAWLEKALDFDSIYALETAASQFVQQAFVETHIQPPSDN